MILYSIQCTRCRRLEPHGSTAPINADSCPTARMMRSSCREMGCTFNVTSSEYVPSDLDALRLGLRPERVVA